MDEASARHSLRIVHRGVLVAIAACALWSALQPGEPAPTSPDPTSTTVAVALGLATVLLRRAATSPVISAATRLVLASCSWACALGLAVQGCLLASNAGQVRTGLVFALAAAIFSLRVPAPGGRRPERGPGAS